MADNDEGLILDGLDLNSAAGPLTVENLDFKPAKKKPLWADNADADGELLVSEAHYTNAFFEQLRIRVEPQADMDAALDVLAQLTDKLQKAERMAAAGGIPLPWTPAASTKTWAWYVILGEYEELPITPTGELAGWFLSSPVVTVKLTCRPFGHGEEKRVLAPVQSAAPLQSALLEDPGGDVPAEARVILTDKAGQDRRHGELGLEQLESKEASPTLLLDSDALVTTGFAGAQAARAGSYDPNASGNNVIRATAVSAAVAMCSTGPIANIGSFRLKPRIYALSENIRIRASYKVGDGPFQALEWKQPTVINAFSEIDIGEATLDRLLKGTQKSEIRIELKSLGANSAVDLDYLSLLPTGKGYGKARGLASDDPNNLLAYDEADQAAGNLTGGYTANNISAITVANPGVITSTAHGLANGDRVWIEGIVGSMAEVLTGFFTVAGVTANTFNVGVSTAGKVYTSGGKISKGGKALPVPNTAKWFGIGDPDDAVVNATSHIFERTAVSDTVLIGANIFGRMFLVDISAIGAVKAQGRFKGTNAKVMSEEAFYQGLLVRYKDVNNWLLAAFAGRESTTMMLRLVKCVGGALGGLEAISSGVAPATEGEIAVSVDAGGVYRVWSESAGNPLTAPRAEGQDSDLSATGPLASGRVGFHDGWPRPEACVRTIDKFTVLTPSEAGRVCYANQSAEARSDAGWEREDADGDDWGPPSIYRGASFYLPPSGDTEAVNRLAAKLRRGDTDAEADSSIADTQELEVWATPRVLIPR